MALLPACQFLLQQVMCTLEKRFTCENCLYMCGNREISALERFVEIALSLGLFVSCLTSEWGMEERGTIWNEKQLKSCFSQV